MGALLRFCSSGCRVVEPRLTDEELRVSINRAVPSTRLSLCGVELFAMRKSMEGQRKGCGMQPPGAESRDV